MRSSRDADRGLLPMPARTTRTSGLSTRKAGKQAVLQLVSTNEASQKRELLRARAEESDLEDLDMTPRDMERPSNTAPRARPRRWPGKTPA
jgi:hypothetical protein